jgi:tetratricopeptide (TPR) repeat protein
MRLVAKLQLYWLPSGMLELGYRLTMEALARPGAEAPTVERCAALYAASQLAYFLGRFSDTAKHAEQSMAIARKIGNDTRALDALLFLGYATDESGDASSALSHYEAAVALARHIGDKARLSYALNALAGYYAWRNDDAALTLYEESAALAREVGDMDAVAVTLQNIGRSLLALNRDDGARRYLLESFDAAADMGATRTLLYVLDACVVLADHRLEWARVAQFLAAANVELSRLGIRRTPGDDKLIGPPAAHARAAMGDSVFSEVTAAARALTVEQVLAEARAWLVGRP